MKTKKYSKEEINNIEQQLIEQANEQLNKVSFDFKGKFEVESKDANNNSVLFMHKYGKITLSLNSKVEFDKLEIGQVIEFK